jgi:hypothetical protein
MGHRRLRTRTVVPAEDFRTKLMRLVRWTELGLLTPSVPEMQQRRLRLLALAERLGLPDHDMLKVKDHPSWNADGLVDLRAARQLLRDAKRHLSKPGETTDL